jgi:thiol-disulfide isomerase/thioredoxin
MKAEYIIGLTIAILVGGGLSFLFLFPTEKDTESSQCMPGGTCPTQTKDLMPQQGKPYIEIKDPSGFVNSDPITIGQFVGKKVILVDFLTYSCINCQRTFPYLNAWDDKYASQGLQIISIHTPEFAFEKDIDNVRAAMEKYGIKNPVVLDNNYGTWRAYGNQYWPRKYLIDIHGNIVYDHIGEGAYDETEKEIQTLLAERAQVLGEMVETSTDLTADAVPEKAIDANSPETYFGSNRNEYLGNGTRGKTGTQNFVAPADTIRKNTLYLGGTWDLKPEYAETTQANATITYHFDAQNVYFVAGADAPVTITIVVDDVEMGTQVVQENTLYTLVQSATSGEHTLLIRVHEAGLQAYTFTFG